MGTADILTFGCRLNAFESEVMRAHAAAAGLTDTVIVNTCAVTAEAERQARQTIRRTRRECPGTRIVVTGCGAQIDPARYAAMAEVDAVIGNAEKLDLESFRRLAADRDGHPARARIRVNDIMAARETAGELIGGFEGRARAFVAVQQGCDHRCTFCIIPFGRGPSRSVPVGAVVQQVRRLVEAGFREAVLTGVDLTDYGKDLPGAPSLGDLVRRLLRAVPELPRLRLSSLDPVEVDPALLDAIAGERRLMPHFHLSAQAGDDMVLKRMKRRHARADVIALTARIHALRPDAVFGADLIAGFPTETEAMFDNTLRLIAEAGLTWLHVFPYSARAGTPAARMPPVPTAVRRERAARLRALGATARDTFLDSRIGRTVRVLVEKDGAGRCEHYAPVGVGSGAADGAIVAARVIRRAGDRLEAALAA